MIYDVGIIYIISNITVKYICNPVRFFFFFFPEVTAASMANLAGLLKEKGRRGIAIIPADTSVGSFSL